MTTDDPRPEPFVRPDEAETAAALDDLRSRLRATRWPAFPADAGWSEGVDLAFLRELVTYWIEEYDCRRSRRRCRRTRGCR